MNFHSSVTVIYQIGEYTSTQTLESGQRRKSAKASGKSLHCELQNYKLFTIEPVSLLYFLMRNVPPFIKTVKKTSVDSVCTYTSTLQ